MHAGGENGFVNGAKLIFKSKTKSGDYHDDMNFVNFKKWLEEKLIPNLAANSVVVIDNASYHNKLDERCPTQATRKDDVKDWLRNHGLPFRDDMLKAELLNICKRNKPDQPKYTIDTILRQHGHDVVRLPPYHPDLNPIELIWSRLKRDVAEKNFTFKIRDIEQLTHDAIDNITTQLWSSCCRHVQDIESMYWKQDIVIEAQLEKVEFTVDSSDEDTDTASDASDTDTADEVGDC